MPTLSTIRKGFRPLDPVVAMFVCFMPTLSKLYIILSQVLIISSGGTMIFYL